MSTHCNTGNSPVPINNLELDWIEYYEIKFHLVFLPKKSHQQNSKKKLFYFVYFFPVGPTLPHWAYTFTFFVLHSQGKIEENSNLHECA
jgi:hypothetical protein